MSIFINVVNQKMRIHSPIDECASGSQKFVRFQFNLSRDWDGLLTFAQFQQNGVAYNQYLDEDNGVYLPPEIKAGTCTLMLYGSRQTVIATTNCLTLRINANNFVSDAQSTEITKSLYTQLVAKVDRFISEFEGGGGTSGGTSGGIVDRLLNYYIEDCDAIITGHKTHIFPDNYALPNYIEDCPVVDIESCAFVNAIFKHLTLPSNLAYIEDYVFENSFLESVKIPRSVTFIGNGAFLGSALTDIYYEGTEEEWKDISIGEQAFDFDKVIIHYNQSSVTKDYVDNTFITRDTLDRRFYEYDLDVQETYATKQEVAKSGSLPPVTSDDNGKLLQVVNGVWAAVEIPFAEGVAV